VASDAIRKPGRASIALLEQLEAATSTADPLAAALPLTKQDKAASRLVRRLDERPGSRKASQSLSGTRGLSKSASLETLRQNPSSSVVAASRGPPSVLVAASADECTAASSSEA
jgi:hypothetical protein